MLFYFFTRTFFKFLTVQVCKQSISTIFEKMFISLSLLEDNFIRYRSLLCFFYFFPTLMISLHSILIYVVSDEQFAVILNPLLCISPSIAAFKIFCFSLVFCNFNIKCLGMYFLFFILFVFSKRVVSVVYGKKFKYFNCLSSFPLPSVIPITQVLHFLLGLTVLVLIL